MNSIQDFLIQMEYDKVYEAYAPIIDFLNENYVEKDYPALESTSNISNELIYVVLMHSGTPLANIIKTFTRDEYSHACISFNPELVPMYSFGQKKLESRELGLTMVNRHNKFFEENKATYSIYAVPVSQLERTKMNDRLNYFIENLDRFQYSFAGLIRIYFSKTTESEKKYFCSRFVADVINAGIPLDKHPSLYKPQDMTKLDNIILVDKGEDFSKINIGKIKRFDTNFKKKMATS